METLKTLLKKHPEWADLPLAVGRSDGELDFVGHSGSVWAFGDDLSEEETEDWDGETNDDGTPLVVLVFEPN